VKGAVITVFGSSTVTPSEPAYQTAYELGRAVAQAGWTLCNGGYGGSMEAAAKGAVEAGGHTIGVTCHALGRAGPNRYIRQEVPTFDLLARLNTLVRLGQAYVVLPGGTGTLLELSLVWELLNKGLLRRRPAPIVLGDFWTPLEELIRRVQPDALPLTVARDACEAVALLRSALIADRAATGAADRPLCPD